MKLCTIHSTMITEDQQEVKIHLDQCSNCLTYVCKDLYSHLYKLCDECHFDRRLRQIRKQKKKSLKV